jgi:predicted aspartyl protease
VKAATSGAPLRFGAARRAASQCQTALRAILALMIGVGSGFTAQAQVLPTPEPERPEAEDRGLDEQPQFAAPTSLDRIGRVLAPVMVNGQGPFRFVVDTGANRTAISARLAAALGLVPDPLARVEVHGVTGMSVMPAVTGTRLVIGDITLEPRRLPVLENVIFADADGILGVEGLQSSRLEVDFVNDEVRIRRSTGRRAPPGYLVMPAKLAYGGLLLVKGRVGKVPADIVIDTGAQRTIGNETLKNALLRSIRTQEPAIESVTGATPGVVAGVSLQAPAIAIGDVRLQDVRVTFADLHVFSFWNLEDRPALVIGMDVLGTVERLVVDYRRREFQFLPRDVD